MDTDGIAIDLNSGNALEVFRNLQHEARPNVDGWVIAGGQYKLYESGKYNDVPVLTGYNSDEGLLFGNPKSTRPTF